MRTTIRTPVRLLWATLLLQLPRFSYEFHSSAPPRHLPSACSTVDLVSDASLRNSLHPNKDLSHRFNTYIHSKPSSNNDKDSSSSISALFEDPTRVAAFSTIMAICGALLGPFLDSYHSAFGVLQYDEPIKLALWGTAENPALITAWWVPVLFGVAGWLIGWLYVLFDAIFKTDAAVKAPTPPKILLGISIFTLQYWLSGVLVSSGALDRTGILNAMSLYAAIGFVGLDGSMAGFLTSAATAIGGPLIEVGLLSLARAGMMPGGYHYTDLGETGFFPLWIAPVYFLGGPAVGNLARGFWVALGSKKKKKSRKPKR